LNKAISDSVRAYDETIQGWAKALEMRDSETMGHSQRIVELTLQLARKLGVKGIDLLHMRRGALLHDIGKMGIPDAILHKPGELSDEEWVIMRKHPVYARDYLSNVSYLTAALDIPYSHHEKWDGTGYPQGLKGEGIPMAARIFAVVDVWDALTSKRPYLETWSRAQALAYIQEQSGRQFDPRVVEAFVELIRSKFEIPKMGETNQPYVYGARQPNIEFSSNKTIPR
jgi:putative nucleotidyltransferase with HDIG domain